VLGGVVDPGRIVQGNGGNDTIIGTLGNDIISGGAGKDKISGGDGNDAMYGGSGEDEVDAGDGNNRVFGNEGSDLIKTGLGDDFISSIDRFGIDRVICGLGRDTFVRDKLDLVRRTSSCDRSIGTPKGASESEEEPEKEPPGATPEIPWDAGELCGETGDELCTPVPEDPNAPPISPEETWDVGFGLEDFDSFGAEFDDSFFGYDDSFGELENPKDLVGATMEIANKGNKITIPKKGKVKNALSVKLLCPKAATRRCVGEMVLSIKPKKGKSKELGAELFRFNKGKTKTLKFKLKSKQLKLIPKGKKGANVRVIVEARDGGDLLFGLDQSVKVTR
jgi:hypothetical protein